MPILRPVIRDAVRPPLMGFGGGSGVSAGPFSTTGAYTAVIGDSIDAGSPASASWYDECCRLSGQRMRNYLNKGVGGNTTAQMLARINADIIAQSPVPNVCVIGGPTNDHGTGVAPATTQQNYIDMVAALRAAGITPAIRNCPSNNTAGGGAFNTIALRRQGILDHNTWLAGYCAAQNIALIDIFTPTYDGTGLTAAFTSDGTHFNAAGCYAAAKYASLRLPAYLNTAPKPYLTTITSDPLNVVVNGVFVGDSNADGVANNCAVTSVTSPSLTANDYDGVGNWQNFTTANGTLGFLDPAAGGVTAVAAHVYEAACILKGAAGKIVKVRIQIRDVGNATLSTIDMVNDWTVATTDEVQVGFARFTAPANSHHFSITVQGVSTGATGQMSCARFTVRDKTANP